MTTIPDDMVERVARAIYEVDDPWSEAWPWPNLNEKQGGADGYRRAARAAIEAMQPAILAAEKRGEERERAKLNAIIDMWKRRDHLSLHSGEVTAQEFRTVVAVLNAIAAGIRKGSD